MDSESVGVGFRPLALGEARERDDMFLDDGEWIVTNGGGKIFEHSLPHRRAVPETEWREPVGDEGYPYPPGTVVEWRGRFGAKAVKVRSGWLILTKDEVFSRMEENEFGRRGRHRVVGYDRSLLEPSDGIHRKVAAEMTDDRPAFAVGQVWEVISDGSGHSYGEQRIEKEECGFITRGVTNRRNNCCGHQVYIKDVISNRFQASKFIRQEYPDGKGGWQREKNATLADKVDSLATHLEAAVGLLNMADGPIGWGQARDAFFRLLPDGIAVEGNTEQLNDPVAELEEMVSSLESERNELSRQLEKANEQIAIANNAITLLSPSLTHEPGAVVAAKDAVPGQWYRDSKDAVPMLRCHGVDHDHDPAFSYWHDSRKVVYTDHFDKNEDVTHLPDCTGFDWEPEPSRCTCPDDEWPDGEVRHASSCPLSKLEESKEPEPVSQPTVEDGWEECEKDDAEQYLFEGRWRDVDNAPGAIEDWPAYRRRVKVEPRWFKTTGSLWFYGESRFFFDIQGSKTMVSLATLTGLIEKTKEITTAEALCLLARKYPDGWTKAVELLGISETEAYLLGQAACGIEVGDWVTVERTFAGEPGALPYHYEGRHDHAVGKAFRVSGCTKKGMKLDRSSSVGVDRDWPYFVLTKCDPPAKELNTGELNASGWNDKPTPTANTIAKREAAELAGKVAEAVKPDLSAYWPEWFNGAAVAMDEDGEWNGHEDKPGSGGFFDGWLSSGAEVALALTSWTPPAIARENWRDSLILNPSRKDGGDNE